MMRRFVTALALTVMVSGSARPQDAMHPEPPSFAEPAQGPRPRLYRDRVEPHWFKSGLDREVADRFWYRNALPGGRSEFVLVVPDRAERSAAFDHAKLADSLGKTLEKSIPANHLPFDAIAIRPEGIEFRAEGKTWRFVPETGEVAPIDEVEPDPAETASTAPRRRGDGQSTRRSARSPDGKWEAITRDHNVVLQKRDGGREWPLSVEGTADDGYETGVYWSPDSSRLVALRTAREQEHTVYFVQSSPASQVQPKLLKHQYLKPGDRVAVTKPHLFDVAAKEEIPVKDELFDNPWSNSQFRWEADSSRFTFLYNQRGHQVLRLVAVDAKSGEARGLDRRAIEDLHRLLEQDVLPFLGR